MDQFRVSGSIRLGGLSRRVSRGGDLTERRQELHAFIARKSEELARLERRATAYRTALNDTNEHSKRDQFLDRLNHITLSAIPIVERDRNNAATVLLLLASGGETQRADS